MGSLAGIARREKKRAPMETLDGAEISVAAGVADDFRGRPGERQVTVISARIWRQVVQELGVDLPWTTRRANLLVEDIDLPTTAGGELQIGAVRLKVNAETAPCSRMDGQCPGLKDALKPDWRGGICCTVVSGGAVRIGDSVQYTPGR